MEDTRHNVKYPIQRTGHRGPGKGRISQNRGGSGMLYYFYSRIIQASTVFPCSLGQRDSTKFYNLAAKRDGDPSARQPEQLIGGIHFLQ